MTDRGLNDITRESFASNLMLRLVPAALALIFLIFYAIAVYWSQEPEYVPIDAAATASGEARSNNIVPGYATVTAAMVIGKTLLDKPGGFLSNDILPPGVFEDDMPAWEYGALVQLRDMAHALRNDFSRSQSQSVEQNDLKNAEPKFNVDRTSWAFPEAESEYRRGIQLLANYRTKLASTKDSSSQFYARSDNLREWLKTVEKRLGNLSQRLSASVVEERENTDLAGDSVATQSTKTAAQIRVKTPWLKIDDVFYESRGSCWALIELLKAVEIDFAGVLKKKNAAVSLKQIIRELEATQETVWSPMILNGSGFGLVANHSLAMASYIARANAAIIDLRDLLSRG